MSSTSKADEPLRASRSLSHLALLATLVALLVVQSFLSDTSILERSVVSTLFFVVVLSAIGLLSGSRPRQWTALFFGVAAYLLSWLVEIQPSVAISTATYACHIAVFSFLIIALSESVFSDGPIDLNRIIGAVSIYLVLGLIWAFVFVLLETLQPGSFGSAREASDETITRDMVSHLTYFSSVTLTTLGYGDIFPVSRPARMFATLEATMGQLYIAIVIARLVGLQISEGRRERHAAEMETRQDD